MKTIAKLVLGGVMLAGAAAAASVPANAGVSIGVNLGVPAVGVAFYGGPCQQPYPYRPAYCYPVYGAPIFVEGAWYHAPVYVRYVGGDRFFWIHNGWVRDRADFHVGFRR
jgi:hypothetical protein